MKNPTVERLLYVALAMVVVATTLGEIYRIRFDHKLDQEILQLKQIVQTQQQIIQNQQQTVNQIKASVADIKTNSNNNTNLIECLINLHASGIVPSMDACQQPVLDTSSSSNSSTTTPPSAPSAPRSSQNTQNSQNNQNNQNNGQNSGKKGASFLDQVPGLGNLFKRFGL